MRTHSTAFGRLTQFSLMTLAPEDEETPGAPPAERWEGIIGMEGELTGDGRLIEHGALRWPEDLATNPLPFRFVKEDVGAHDGAVVSGHIDTIERRDGGVIWGSGDYDMGSPEGVEAFRQLKEKLTTGVSMDLDDVSFEVRVASDLMGDDEDGGLGMLLAGADKEKPKETRDPEKDYEVLFEAASDDEIMVMTDARVRSATQVSIPAFAGAIINWVQSSGESVDDIVEQAASAEVIPLADTSPESLVAAAVPVEPPKEWFFTPEPNQVTALTIDDDGHIYGHLATWDACHIASPAGEGICVLAPRSAQQYNQFHTGAVKTKEGSLVPTGKITMGTGHSGPQVNAIQAAAHYDNTGAAVADVRAVDGAHGIWVSGALRPNVKASQVRALRASPLSGDWRKIGGQLELVAALAVNVPGFHVPRPNGLVASGELASLVAAGMVAPRRVVRPGTEGALSASDLAYLKRLAHRERTADARDLALRVARTKNELKVRAFAASKGKK